MFLSLALVTIVLVPCAFTYAAGLNAGRFQGETAAHLIFVAMKAGPAEALAWGQLMQDNNGASAMAALPQKPATGCRRAALLPDASLD